MLQTTQKFRVLQQEFFLQADWVLTDLGWAQLSLVPNHGLGAGLLRKSLIHFWTSYYLRASSSEKAGMQGCA